MAWKGSFFFQAEDGIRDIGVTGVQTCALPICVSATTDRPEDGTPTLELRGVNKSFGAIQVLHDVHLKVYPGQVTALVGDNGAGKSTLIKSIAGIHAIDSGELIFEGRPVTVSGPRDAAALGIEIVYQDLALCEIFGAIQVLHDVHLKVYPGQVTALVGDNGAGKSTLIKSIAGIHAIDSGELIFEGRPVTVSGPRDAAALGIEIVYQDLALCDNLDVVQNMFLGRERKNGVFLDETSMEQAARDTLSRLSVRTLKSARQLVSSLSGGHRQTVAIANAVLSE